MAPVEIPSSLHASLLARLDHLAPTREVAQIGAALGRSFSYELISAVAGMPQQKLDDALDQLVRAELIFRRGMPPDAEYTFKHALVQDAAYSTLLRSRRQQLHGRIATTLETRFPEIVTDHPELMAHHCAEAGMPDKAVNLNFLVSFIFMSYLRYHKPLQPLPIRTRSKSTTSCSGRRARRCVVSQQILSIWVRRLDSSACSTPGVRR